MKKTLICSVLFTQLISLPSFANPRWDYSQKTIHQVLDSIYESNLDCTTTRNGKKENIGLARNLELVILENDSLNKSIQVMANYRSLVPEFYFILDNMYERLVYTVTFDKNGNDVTKFKYNFATKKVLTTKTEASNLVWTINGSCE